jgi:hypothetical protein
LGYLSRGVVGTLSCETAYNLSHPGDRSLHGRQRSVPRPDHLAEESLQGVSKWYWELSVRCEAAREMGKAPLPRRLEGSLAPEICPGLGVEQVEPAHIEVDRHFMHWTGSGRGVQASHKGVIPSSKLDDDL